MSLYVSVPLLLLVAVIQSTLLPRLAVTAVHPDLMLLVVVAWGLLKGNPDVLVWGFIGGLSLDLFSGLPLGAGTLPMLVVAGLAGVGAVGVSGRHFAVPLTGAFLATFAYYGISVLVLNALGRPLPLATFVLQTVLPASLLNVLTMILVFPLMRGLHRLTVRGRLEI